MRFDNSRGTFADIVSNFEPHIVKIAYRLRDLIAEVYPDVVEIPRPAEQHAAYAIGLNKMTEIFGYMCPRVTYVRLGFYFGGALPDREGSLLGTGKRLRHMKMYSLADVERPEVRRLIEEAVRERQTTLSV